MPEVSAADVRAGARLRERPRPFSWKCEPGASGLVWLRLAGELDLSDCPRLRRALSEAEKSAATIAVDLRELTFIDCAGIVTLLGAKSRARRSGGELWLLAASGQVERVLEVIGIRADVGRLDLATTTAPLHADSNPRSQAATWWLDGGSHRGCPESAA